MNNTLSDIYQYHHTANRPTGYSLLQEERGRLISGKIGRGKKVLDIGCRDGSLTLNYLEGNDVWGVDVDAASLTQAAQKGIKTVLMDLNGDWLELLVGDFDVIVAGEIVEHLYFPQKVISKVKARLAPGGLFIGSVPNAFSLLHRIRYALGKKKNTPLADPTHLNHFSYWEIKDLLKNNFSEAEIIGLGRFTKLAKLLPRWFAFDLLFMAKK